jgi:hypothetical protein
MPLTNENDETKVFASIGTAIRTLPDSSRDRFLDILKAAVRYIAEPEEFDSEDLNSLSDDIYHVISEVEDPS